MEMNERCIVSLQDAKRIAVCNCALRNKTSVCDNQGRVANLDINNAQIIAPLKIEGKSHESEDFAGRYS